MWDFEEALQGMIVAVIVLTFVVTIALWEGLKFIIRHIDIV